MVSIMIIMAKIGDLSKLAKNKNFKETSNKLLLKLSIIKTKKFLFYLV